VTAATLDPETLAGVSPEAWLQFLEGRRWFPTGATSARLVAAAPLAPDVALALVAVGAARPWVCQLLLVAQDMSEWTGSGEQVRKDRPRALVQHGEVAVIEACDAPQAFSALAPALRGGVSLGGQGARWAAEAVAGGFAGEAGEVVRIGGEQSNTAVVFAGAALFKLFRKIEAGKHPELEIGRHLTAKKFPHSPPLLAALTVETDEGPATAGVLHAYLSGQIDGWAHAIGRTAVEMAPEAQRLGAATRAMHEVLATGDLPDELTPHAVIEADRERWAEGLRATAAGALGRLAERRSRLSPRAQRHAEELLARSGQVVAAAEEKLRAAAGVKIRVHGDYHLGQVLFDPTHGSWMILDFEGEPSRPLAERRLRQVPLRDVAGMLRSFGYAAQVGGHGEVWERTVCEAFLAGYDAAAAPGSPVPAAQGSPLLDACLIERAFYELSYELDYRPDNAWIPLAAILALAVAR
jgi:predicted trehalose synthase